MVKSSHSPTPKLDFRNQTCILAVASAPLGCVAWPLPAQVCEGSWVGVGRGVAVGGDGGLVGYGVAVGGRGVAVGRGVLVGRGVAVGRGVLVGRGVAVGRGVLVGRGVAVGRGVLVGRGVAVGGTGVGVEVA